MSPANCSRSQETIKQVTNGNAANTAHRANSGAPGTRTQTPAQSPARGLTALPELNPYSWKTPSVPRTTFDHLLHIGPAMPHHQSRGSPSQGQRYFGQDVAQMAREQDAHSQEECTTRAANQSNLNADAPPFTMNRERESQPAALVKAERRFNPTAASFDPRQIQSQQQEQPLARAAQQPFPGYQFGYNMYPSPGHQSGGPLEYGNQGKHAGWGVPGPSRQQQQQVNPTNFRFPAAPAQQILSARGYHQEQQVVPVNYRCPPSADLQQQMEGPESGLLAGSAGQQVEATSHGRHRKMNHHKHHREPKHKIGYPCPDHDSHCHFHHSDEFCHIPWQDCQLARKAICASFHAHSHWKGAPTGWNEEHDRCVKAGASVGDMCPMHRRIHMDSLQSHERELLQSPQRR